MDHQLHSEIGRVLFSTVSIRMVAILTISHDILTFHTKKGQSILLILLKSQLMLNLETKKLNFDFSEVPGIFD